MFNRRRKRERDLERELRSDLELETEERGDSYAARRALGNAALIKEQVREIWGWTWLERLVQDLRYALRAMRHSRGFTLTSVVSLALGIGANTAIFSLIDALLLRWLPVRDPQHLVQLVVPQPKTPLMETFSYPLVNSLAAHTDIFSGVLGFTATALDVGSPEAEGSAQNVQRTGGAIVTGEYYETLGLAPAAGRLLTPDDDRLSAPAVAVISDGYWARMYGRDPGAVGKTIKISGVPFTIVGVGPSGFSGVTPGQVADITLPFAMQPRLQPEIMMPVTGANYAMLRVLARVREDIPAAQVKARLAVLWPQLVQGSPFRGISLKPDLVAGGAGLTALRTQFRQPLLVLMALVALVLLIASANVANLLLARAAARQREIAVRLAIGAGRGRIIRQLLTESALLAVCGAALGIGLAWFGSGFLLRILSSGQPTPILLDVSPNRDVLLFTIVVAFATATLFGIAPAFRATAVGPSAALKDNASQLAAGRSRLASALVMVQIGLSLLLLIGAGLFVRTLQNLRHLDAGFRHDGILLVSFQGNRPPNGAPFYQELLGRIERLPGVSSAALGGITPLNGGSMTYGLMIHGTHVENINLDRVGPRYFETMRTPILAGREFTMHDDRNAPAVAIVNQAFVKQYFPDGHAVGQHITLDGSHDDAEVIGVVQDVRSRSLRAAAVPSIYTPAFHESFVYGTVVVRASGSLIEVISELRREASAQAPQASVQITPLTVQVERTLVQERLMATLASTFGALALTLASIGLYGLLAYSVARRTGEIGIRMALGAEGRDILSMILRDALVLLATGVIFGLPAAWAVSRLVSSMLFGLTATDLSTIAGAVVVLVVAGVIAGLLPAMRAAKVDPMAALRYE
jgi:putative ABC transport system permease protein